MSVKFASASLKQGTAYTRNRLAQIFGIRDATLNTGVFRANGYSSIFLFVTKTKLANQTQYKDQLLGDTLSWQGQSSGRTDSLIIEHAERGFELLVFYRESPKQFGDSAFCFEGTFEYVQHTAGHPTNFVLRRAAVD